MEEVRLEALGRTGVVETERERIERLLFGPWPFDVPDPGPGNDEPDPEPEPLSPELRARLLAAIEKALGEGAADAAEEGLRQDDLVAAGRAGSAPAGVTIGLRRS